MIIMHEFLLKASPEELSITLEENLVEQIRFFGTSPLVKLFEESEYITRLLTGLPIAIYNLIAGANFALSRNDLNIKVQETLKPFKKHQAPTIWWVGPRSKPKHLKSILLDNGLKLFSDMTIMSKELNEKYNYDDLAKGFSFKEVNNTTLLKIWVETQTLAYEGDPSRNNHFYDFEVSLGVKTSSPWVRYIGYFDNKPIGVAILFKGNESGVAAAYNIAVLPQYRRRGFGRSLTLIPMIEARKLGYNYILLKATSLGVKLYESINFQKCGTIGFYYLPSKE